MRKLFFLCITIFLLAWLASFFLPARVNNRLEQLIPNNQSVVWQELTTPDSLVNWMPFSPSSSDIEHTENAVFWSKNKNRYSLTITKSGKDTINYIITDAKETFTLRHQLLLTAKGDKQTLLKSHSETSPTINMQARYRYWFGENKLKQTHQEFINSLIKKVTQIHYERFALTSLQNETLDNIVFALPKTTTPQQLSTSKQKAIDGLLLKRLSRYGLLDTTQQPYLEYTRWTDTIITYNICLPLLKIPSAKQASYLQWNGKTKRILGNYKTAVFYGAPGDLPLAWDSLYQKVAQKQRSPQGFPLEKQILSADGTGKERRKLHIKTE